MRQVRPPPKVVPPKPPSHLFDPAPAQSIPSSYGREYGPPDDYNPSRGPPSRLLDNSRDFPPRDMPRDMPRDPRDMPRDPRDMPRDPRDIPRDPRDMPRDMPRGYPSRDVPPNQRESPRDYQRDPMANLDYARNRDPYDVPKASSKPSDFDLDVQLQMKQLEDHIRKMLEDDVSGGNLPSKSSYPEHHTNSRYEPPRMNLPTDRVPEKYPIVNDHMSPRGAPPQRGYPVDDRQQEKSARQRKDPHEIPDDPYNRHNAKPRQEPKASPRNEEGFNIGNARGNPSPARRKGGAMNHLYETDDNLRQKAERQALYSQQLQQQMQEKMGRGHRDPVLESPPKREILRAREERDPNMGTGLALGTDKNREKEMKRQKQLEYKQQLDQITAQKGSDNRHGGNETSPRRSRLPQEEPHGRFDQQQPYSGRSDPYSYDDRHGPNRREAPPPRPQENLRQPDYASNGRHKEPESSYTDKYQFQIGQSAANTKATITSLSDQEKDVRRLRQEEYRRQLDAQKGDKQKRLDEEKAAAEKLERIFETDKSASSPPQKSAPIVDVPPKSQRGYPEDDRDRRGKEPYQDEGDSYGRRDDYGAPHRPQYPPSKAVSFDEGYSTSNDKRIPDDILYDERFQALLKERLMQDQEKQIRDQLRKESYQPEPRKDARDDYRSSEYYRREETDYVRPRDSHNYDNRDSAPPGGYEGRLQLDERSYAGGNHHAPSASYQDSNAVSPGKSPKPARNQLVQDIYGKNSLTEHNDSAGKDSWKPSGKNYTEKQKASINEQKAALDLQIEADKARKKAEKEAEKALELKLEQKLQATMNAEKEHARIEKEKKSKLLEQSQKELADMQEKKTKEALARKNLLSKRDNEATPNGKNVPPGSEMRANNRSYEERTYSDPPRDHRHEDTRGSYEHIRSPLKDLLDSNPSQRDSYNPPANYHNSPPRGGNRPPPNVSSPNRNYLQEPLTADSVDRFMNNYQNKVRDSPTRHAAPPPQVHSNYNHPARDSYDRDYDNRRDYADPYYPPPRREPPPQYYEQQRAPYVDRSYDRQSENDGDFSFVSESRFVPANPWRASDIISAMIPLQSVPEYGKQMNAAQYPAVDASYDRGPPPASKKPKNDLEQSLASDSLLMYLGRRTPMTEPKVANDDSMRSTAANTMANASSASIVTNARGKTAERLDPASMPVAGRPTSKHAEALGNHESPRPNSGIEVRRVIQQPIVPTAEDVPNNRVFVNKAQQNSQHPPQSDPREDYHQYPERSVMSQGRSRSDDVANKSSETGARSRGEVASPPSYVSNTMNEIMKEAATSSGNNTGRRMPLDAANRDYLKQSPRENVNSTVEAHVQSYSSSNQSEIEHYDPRHRRGDVSHANQLYLKPKEESHGHNSRPHSGSMHGNTSQSMGPMLAQEDDDAGHYEPRRRGDLNTANRMYLAPRNDDRNRDNGDAGTSSRPNSSNRGQLSTGESQGRKWDTSSHTRDETLKYLEQQAAAASLVQNRHPPSFNPPARYDAYEDSFEKE